MFTAISEHHLHTLHHIFWLFRVKTNNLDSKANIWFYYDVHHATWLFLNGEFRNAMDTPWVKVWASNIYTSNSLSQKFFSASSLL